MRKYELCFAEQMLAAFNSTLSYYVYDIKQAVDRELLEKAAARAMQLHPLFRTKLEKDESGLFYLAENNSSPVIRQSAWEDSISYGTEEYHEFMWLLTYTGTKIVFAASHTLCDGTGAVNFMRSVLRAYFEQQGVAFAEPDIAPEQADKTTEPMYLTCVDPTVVPVGRPKPTAVLATEPSFYETDPEKISVYRFQFNKNDLKLQAANSETSLFAVIAYYLAKAMELSLPAGAGNIRLQVPYNMRTTFGGLTDRNFAELTELNYSIEKMGKLPRHLVETAFRSQLDLIIDETNLIAKNNEIAAKTAAMQADPSMLADMAAYLEKAIFGSQACITYTHLTQLRFPRELEERLGGVEMTENIGPSNLIAVVGCTFGDTVTLAVLQSTKNDILIANLRSVLDAENFTYLCQRIIPHGELKYEPKVYQHS